MEQQIQEKLNLTVRPKEETEDQKKELMTAGEAENGCSYYYWQLEEPMRVEYMRILNGIRAMDEEINVFCSEDEMVKIVQMMFADHPELFWTEQSYRYTMYDSWSVIRPTYICQPEEKEQREVLIEQAVAEGLSSVPENSSVYECMKSLYTYVVNTVEYDLDAPDNQNIYSSMVNRVSVCTGYAKELQYLLQRAGIQALLVQGDVEERGSHAWLIANLDGSYVHLDPTFGDPGYFAESEETGEIPEVFQVDYTYLCCDDASILRGRTVSEDLPLPACDMNAWLYYPMRGLYFDECSDAVLISFQESIERGEHFWEGQFSNEAAYEQMMEQLQEGVFSNLILANHPDWGSVLLHLNYKEDNSYVIKLWY